MYRPPAFREDRPEVLHAAIRAHPLALLVTYGESGLQANLLPFMLAVDEGRQVLRAHLAKANDQVGEIQDGAELLVVFQGPQAYISPSWYATKSEDGKVVPTWNYVVVQVRGKATLTDDPSWLLAQASELTAQQEQWRDDPWSVSDAPAPFISGKLRGITGIEIEVERIEGKWKTSQNQPLANRAGVAAALRDHDRGSVMASLVSGF